MSEQFVDAVEQRPIRHLGVYRSVVGDKGISRPLTIQEARLDGCLLRTLFRKDHSTDCEGLPEGLLASYVHEKMTNPAWVACMTRLLDWRMIEIVPAYYGDARRIALTQIGRHWALQLIGERQIEGRPVDGIEELALGQGKQ
jgi:hypothetical protein